jgi:hypothetical protein
LTGNTTSPPHSLRGRLLLHNHLSRVCHPPQTRRKGGREEEEEEEGGEERGDEGVRVRLITIPCGGEEVAISGVAKGSGKAVFSGSQRRYLLGVGGNPCD